MYIENYTPLQAQWIANLRSGDYKQAQGALKDVIGCYKGNDTIEPIIGYCCLGVACETVVNSDLPDYLKPDTIKNEFAYDGEGGVMPYSVYIALNIQTGIMADNNSRGNPIIDIGFPLRDRDSKHQMLTRLSLTELNDSVEELDGGSFRHKFTFSMIADVIEYFADQIFY